MRPRLLTPGRGVALAATAIVLLLPPAAHGPDGTRAQAAVRSRTFALDSTAGLVARGVDLESVEHRGRSAVRVTEMPAYLGDRMAIVDSAEFKDGAIEVLVAGTPAAGAVEGARGFIGIAFRLRPDLRQMECLYIRPTNGRADDQLRRNHSTQYVSHPDFPWQRLRQEAPGVYESYVDLEPGAWTAVRIAVSGTRARLYVHGADQPALIVNDLKLGTAGGSVALWIGPGTEGYFSDLRITSAGR
jgi:hypothetical protein